MSKMIDKSEDLFKNIKKITPKNYFFLQTFTETYRLIIKIIFWHNCISKRIEKSENGVSPQKILI